MHSPEEHAKLYIYLIPTYDFKVISSNDVYWDASLNDSCYLELRWLLTSQPFPKLTPLAETLPWLS